MPRLQKFLCLSLVMVMSLPWINGAAFSDVDQLSYPWAYKEIDEMTDTGIIKGYTDGSFRPEQEITKVEALVLAARVLGFLDLNNSKIVNYAASLHETLLAEYKTDYKREISYLLYKNVLKTGDIPQYIGADNATTGLRRYEAAVLLTKTLGAEEAIDPSSRNAYTDSDDIPASMRPYVNYVSSIGLMKAMDVSATKNDFKPMFAVNRAQMAVLLYRVLGMRNLTFSGGTVEKIDKETSQIWYKGLTGSAGGLFVNPSTVTIRQNGFTVALTDVAVGGDLVFTYVDGVLTSCDVVAPVVDEEYVGVVASVFVGREKNLITIKTMDEGESKEFEIAPNYHITYEGAPIALSNIKSDDYVKLSVSGGLVTKIISMKKEQTINGIISEFILEPTFLLGVKITDGTEKTFSVTSNVTVRRNNSNASLQDVKVGDKVEILVRYDSVVNIAATSKDYNVQGIVEEIVISKQPNIKIKSGEEVLSLVMDRTCTFVIEGKDASIYDLRLGAQVTLFVESETVVKVSAQAVISSDTVAGVIQNINVSYGVITVGVPDGNGDVVKQQVFIKRNSVKVIDGKAGKDIDVNELAEGMVINAIGAEKGGIFEATSIIVMPLSN